MLPIIRSVAITIFLIAVASPSEASPHGVPRYPDLHDSNVVFSSSGDLWLITTKGGTAHRITSHSGEERFAHFSPDGEWIAFSGHYYGNEDVFIIPVHGGNPLQLTYHPARDQVVGWDEAGRIVFRSRREAPFFQWKIYAVTVSGGFPEKLPYERAAAITFEPDGDRVAITTTFRSLRPWKRYKGGWAEKIWIGNSDVPKFDLVSHSLGNEKWPMWHENGRIYFLADSTGRMNIWSMEPDGNSLSIETSFLDHDIRFPSLNGDKIIFQHGMDLKLYDIRTKNIQVIDLKLPSDIIQTRTKFIEPHEYITSWSCAPDGKSLVVATRGELFTLPVKMPGIIRQRTYTSGSREKWPSFIPGAKESILALSDESGEDQLSIIHPGMTDNFQKVEAKPVDGYKLNPENSPDGKWVAFSDYAFRLFVVDMTSGRRTQIDNGGWDIEDYAWSPDSRYLAYSFESENLLNTLHIYDTKTAEKHPISDNRFSTYSPTWDPEGRYLYCVTDRNFNGLTDYNKGLFFFDHQGTLALYRLKHDTPSPFMARGDTPDSDRLPHAFWNAESETDIDKEDWQPSPIEIDFDGLSNRMEPFPAKPGNYGSLKAVRNNLYYLSSERSGRLGHNDLSGYNGPYLMVYDLVKREASSLADEISGFDISADLKTLVIRKEDDWYYADTGEKEVNLSDENRVPTEGWRMEVTPGDEWRQILHEAWRLQRDFFYDEVMHGVDWEQVLELYEPYIDRITTREELVDLIREIQGELHAGHAYIGGGDFPEVDKANVGLLGADLYPHPESGYYQFGEILNPEPGTVEGSSPLLIADPMLKRGYFLLAVNGRRVDASKNILRLFLDQAGKEIALTVNEKPSQKGAREIVVTTLKSEYQIRYLDWVKNNREYVAEKSGDRIAYIQLPDMSGDGLSQIGRDYFSQRTAPAMIIDDRYNGGGNVAEYLLKILDSDVWAVQQGRYGNIDVKPHGGYFGHVAVLCNLETFSDGESFAEATKRLGIGKLIGTRTWGGWIWITGRHPLVDNAFISEPEFGGWGLDGEWLIEGHGVEPDLVVVNDPASEIRGEDKQLNAAIDHLLNLLAEDPRHLPKRPAPKVVK